MKDAIALEMGYFGVIRNPGDHFPVPDDTASNRWMLVDGEPFVDDKGFVYDKILNNEVLLPGVTKLPMPQSIAETNTGATVAQSTAAANSVI